MPDFAKVLNRNFVEMVKATPTNLYRYMWDKIFPVVNTTQKTGDILSRDLSNLMILDGLERADGSPFKQIKHKIAREELYAMKNKGIETQVGKLELQDAHELARQMRQKSLFLDPIISAKQDLMDTFIISKEAVVSQLVRDPDTYEGGAGGDNVFTPSDLWSDYSASDPVLDITNLKEVVRLKTGVTPNTLIISAPVMAILKNHPKIIARIQKTVTITEEEVVGNLPGIFGVKAVHVADAVYNGGKEGLADGIVDFWGNDCFLFYSDAVVDQKNNRNITKKTGRVFGRTYQYPGMNGLSITDTFYDKKVQAHVFQAEDLSALALVSNNVGVLLDDVIA